MVRMNVMGDKMRGFTLVELALSLAFISMLSIAVALIMSNAIANYHRGVILNQVNTVGMDLVDDIRAVTQNSHGRSLKSECAAIYTGDSGAVTNSRSRCESDGGKDFASVTISGKASVRGSMQNDMPIYGAFCTGSYSYIWNSGYLYDDADEGVEKAKLRYRAGSAGTKEATGKLMKVKDEDRAICVSTVRNGYGSPVVDNGVFDLSNGDLYNSLEEDPVDVLEGDNGNLALYSLSVAPTEDAGLSEIYYSISFILATVQGGISIKTSGDYCVPPGDEANAGVEAFDYCAINKFNFAAQANGG